MPARAGQSMPSPGPPVSVIPMMSKVMRPSSRSISPRRSSDHISEPSSATRSRSEPRSNRSRARHLEEAQRIGGDGGQHRGPEVAHELQLQGRAAGADRHHHRPDPLGPVVEPEAAGEEAERRRHLHHVPRAHARRHEAARHHRGPLLHVGARVRVDDRVAGGARGHVHAQDAPGLGAGEAERIGVAQLVLGEERAARTSRRPRGCRRAPRRRVGAARPRGPGRGRASAGAPRASAAPAPPAGATRPAAPTSEHS